MLINFSNHPIDQWETTQIKEANKIYGMCYDLTFPQIDPSKDEIYIKEIAKKYLKKIISIKNDGTPLNVHIMGELTFVYEIVTMLKRRNITCVASTTKRDVEQNNCGDKISKFEFVRFREY